MSDGAKKKQKEGGEGSGGEDEVSRIGSTRKQRREVNLEAYGRRKRNDPLLATRLGLLAIEPDSVRAVAEESVASACLDESKPVKQESAGVASVNDGGLVDNAQSPALSDLSAADSLATTHGHNERYSQAPEYIDTAATDPRPISTADARTQMAVEAAFRHDPHRSSISTLLMADGLFPTPPHRPAIQSHSITGDGDDDGESTLRAPSTLAFPAHPASVITSDTDDDPTPRAAPSSLPYAQSAQSEDDPSVRQRDSVQSFASSTSNVIGLRLRA